ncbi:hypothetical protein Lsed01_02429 [Demequina sediminis]|uniref:Uncharacterized protein n=1 Tax=Demequina sediminis TaxID=1930058 RepID=A0ABP9WJF2_9MICO|nr:hypothetical protein [Demequina sediminis]BDZ62946.1 hypothetical protein GCM10025873_27370 [Demequina sediminis]
MAVDPAPTSVDIERRIVAAIRTSLPSTWRVIESKASRGSTADVDLELSVEAPGGEASRLLVEVKQAVERRDVARIADRLRGAITERSGIPMVGARYLSQSVRDALTAERIAYADATGNMRLESNSPAVFISCQGAESDPWRKGRPRGTLKGEPAARIARTLLDYDRTWRVRELIAVAGASSGATYRVLDYLQREDLVVKEGDRYAVTDWERLLRTWSADASFTTTTRTMAFIEPRGLDAFLAKLDPKPAFPVAVTGTVAAKEWAMYAPAKAAYVYVSSIQEAADAWSLRPNSVAPNVVLLEPATVGDVPFRNVTPASAGYPVAALAQVVADLLNGPGREPAEGEYLIEWMRANESRWRRE